MMRASGGVAAAAGLGFQYMATLSALLDRLESGVDDFEIVTEHEAHDALDYAISTGDGIELAAQAKASVDGPSGTELGCAELVAIARRLTETQAQRYRIDTNRPLTRSARALLRPVGAGSRADGVMTEEWEFHAPNEPADGPFRGWQPTQVERAMRLTVCARALTNDEFSELLTRRLISYRRQRLHGVGVESGRILLGHMVATLLLMSGRRWGRVLTRQDAQTLVCSPAQVLGAALGQYDWGAHSGAVPVFERVTRSGLLVELVSLFKATGERGSPSLVALQGFSGSGKSTVAASFAELAATRYDHVVWFDATAAASIAARASRVLHADPAVGLAQLAEQWCQQVGGSPDQWLLVFDNAESSASVREWIPPFGHVDVIATSTSRVGWSAWREMTIAAMEEDEAVGLVGLRLGIELELDDLAQARLLVQRLDYWPLAIELACAYLAQSGRGLAVTQDYLDRLTRKVIDDPTLMPSSYRTHSSLLEAIEVALDLVLDVPPNTFPENLSPKDVLDSVAYLPPRQASALLAAHAAHIRNSYTTTISPQPYEDLDNELWLDDVLRKLAASSLVHILKLPDLGPCLQLNAIVADLVRARQGSRVSREVVSSLQDAAYLSFHDGLNNEEFRQLAAIRSNCEAVLDHALRNEALTLRGVVLCGNMAQFEALTGDFRRALNLYRIELDHIPNPATRSALAAKAWVGTAAAQLNLGKDYEVVAASISEAVQACENAVGASEESREQLRTCATQILEICELIGCRHPDGDQRLTIWRDGLNALGFDVTPTAAHRLRLEFSNPGNDDDATLKSLRVQADEASSKRDRCTMLFAEAEGLSVVGRFAEAAEAFRVAASTSVGMGLGVGPGWPDILNAWRTASIRILGGDLTGQVRVLCDALIDISGDQKPSADGDREDLALFRFAAACQTEAQPLVERLEGELLAPATPSLRQQALSYAEMIATACRDVVKLRREYGWPPIIPMAGWGRGGNPFPTVLIIPGAGARGLPDSVSRERRTASWIVAPQGVGLRVGGSDGFLIWTWTTEAGWLGLDGPVVPGTDRLRELVLSSQGRGSVMVAAPDTELVSGINRVPVDEAIRLLVIGVDLRLGDFDA